MKEEREREVKAERREGTELKEEREGEVNGGRREGGAAATRNYRELLVWRRAHEFVLAVCRFSGAFPNHELFGLTSQIRLASAPRIPPAFPEKLTSGPPPLSSLPQLPGFSIPQLSNQQ